LPALAKLHVFGFQACVQDRLAISTTLQQLVGSTTSGRSWTASAEDQLPAATCSSGNARTRPRPVLRPRQACLGRGAQGFESVGPAGFHAMTGV
jgi:hypothetical protein